MRNDKKEATDLRKSGKSFNQIHKELGIPVSTLSGWFKDKKWSQQITEDCEKKARVKHVIHIKNLNRIRGEKLKEIYKDIDKLEKSKIEVTEFHKRSEEFSNFAIPAFIILFFGFILEKTYLKQIL